MTTILLWCGVGFLCALGLAWLTNVWQRQVQLRRSGDAPQVEELMRHYSHQLAGMIEDRPTMVQLLTDEIPQALAIDKAALLFVVGQELVASTGLRLPINHLVMRQVAAVGAATRITADLAHLLAQGHTDLAWTTVWAPLMRGATLQGLWLLGARRQDCVYTDGHLQWLTTLARQAALLLETVDYAEREQRTARQMQMLYRQAVSASEGERQRLARELHDGVLQDLCALARDLKALAHKATLVESQWEPLERYTNEAVTTLRTICHDLRPPFLTDNLPLALRTLVARVDGRAAVRVSFKTNVEAIALPTEVTLALYRITQEALNNALHHADASEILVRLTQYPAILRLTIHDDGCGIAESHDLARFVATGHYGLAGMSERAKMIDAKLELYTALDYGTAVIVAAPLANRPHNDEFVRQRLGD